MKHNKNTFTDIALLLVVTVIAYLPVSAFLLSLENDSLVQYLPYRYHLSESIRHGHFPFWSPYLYTGFPVHADMQGMTWNPIVLLISCLTHYNMSVLELELTIYLVLAAVSMYFLLRSFSFHRGICIIGGISYMSCGFITGSASVIPWISSAAFIPFVLLGLKNFLGNPGLRQALFFSAGLCFLFLCGYPTFFIYTSYITGVILAVALVRHYRKQQRPSLKKPLFCFLGALLLFLLICSPAIISYWEFLPYYSRGSGITVQRAAQNPFTPFSSISFLVPGAVHKDHAWLQTDTSMRNSYVGLFVFLLFLLSFRSRFSTTQKLIAGITLFSFLLSLGSATPLHKLCYAVLPLFNTFRHPGNIRLFTSMGILLLAAFYAQQLLTLKKEEIIAKIKPALYIILGILGAAGLYLLLQSATRQNLLTTLQQNRAPKALLDGFSFNAFLLIQCLAQIFFIVVLLLLLRRKAFPAKCTGALIAFNAVAFCWLALPFNVVSQIRTKAINEYLLGFPKGYPAPDLLASVQTGTYADSTGIPVHGYPNFYNKQIRLQDYVITPTLNKDYEKFCGDKSLRKALDGYPFVWLQDTVSGAGQRNDNGKISIERFGPNGFTFRVNSNTTTELHLFQQYNHNWTVVVNGERSPVLKRNTAFMAVAVPAGESRVAWVYRPVRVITSIWVALSAIVLTVLLLIFNRRKLKNLDAQEGK